MEDDICGKIDYLKKYLPDNLENSKLDFYGNSNFQKYCPNNNCHTDLEEITIGFLWLLEQYFTIYRDKGNSVNDAKPFFLYIILWLSYKLNKNSEHKTTQINEFYTKYINNSDKHGSFISDSNRYTNLREFIDKQKDLFNINIENLSKFYDAFKLLCNIHSNLEMNDHNKLPNNANEFVKKYQELNGDSNNTDKSSYGQILTILSTDYNKLKEKCRNITSLPELTANISALTSEYTSSSSSIGNKLFTVLSIFGAIALFLGISYKYSLFGFRKRFQKQKLREKIKNVKKKMNR
ncbi:PIR protein [Plasmodium yoelii]|uniref:PIR protein n=2 Tax=Plasmodium yoelii TaxID=5861 RepID=A0AAE9WRZ2_PLAYO|nr:PIR protein [Plasmodium yoelii]WBY55504.1 PIR protein [Plasmodium yoelii yoelii]CDU16607.1 YIR protein [Plasmodium yoelii]VTZ74032.1 PIR protein [Plasmodium yoelii]|eukprot:XP_022811617.1 PIR protein [Plasmodium yoelii]